MPNPYVGAGFDQSIGTRTKPGQNQVEFYNTQNPSQAAFGNPRELATFAQSISGRNDINEQNVFDIVKQGFTPRADALNQITDSLNAHQDQLFQGSQAAPKRQSSSLADSIAADESNIDSALAEFNTLKTKLSSLTAPNYEQSYNDLRTAQGLPQLESDFAANNKTIRELPYVTRMNSGNAGIETEGQLAADTAQKGIPLEIQQGNLLDRLKLAQDFITNSLNLKEKDYNTSKEGIASAISLVADTLNLTRTHLQDLTAKQQEQQAREEMGQQFAFDNRVTAPFYDIGGTVYRTSDRMPAHNQAEYVAMGGKGDFSDVQKISPKVDPVSISPGETLIDPATGKVIYQAPSKSTGTVPIVPTTPVNSEEARVRQIIAANPGEWGHAADQIDTEFGKGTATKYDALLKSVYQDGKNVGSIQTGSTGNPVVDSWVDLIGKGQAKLSDVPSAYKNAVANAVSNSGVSPTETVKLSAAQQETVNTYNTLYDLTQQALDLGNKTGFAGTGGFGQGSLKQFLAKNLGTGSADAEQLRNLIGNIKATLAKARGGTSFTPNEEKLLESYTPGIDDSGLVLTSKLNGLQQFIKTATGNITGQKTSSGIAPSGGATTTQGVTSSGLSYTIIQ